LWKMALARLEMQTFLARGGGLLPWHWLDVGEECECALPLRRSVPQVITFY
jgi:hypothetical protein